jgi:ADP-L-glycero-D-manno-heptose 6-epimerase
LQGKYQSYTQADVGLLRAAGYTVPFTALEEGIARYHRALTSEHVE